MNKNTTITKFDIPTLKSLDPELNKALAEVGKKFGITIKMDSGGKYDAKTANLKIKLTVLNPDGSEFDADSEEFIKMARAYPNLVNPEWLDKTFLWRNRTYKVVGYKPGRKFGIVTHRDDGETYLFSVNIVKENFKLAA
jgi:hypothetical protein